MFVSPKPVTWDTHRRLLPDHLDPITVLVALREHCAARGVNLVEDGGGWVFRTAPDLAEKLREALRETRRLPRVAMECLVIIAYNSRLPAPRSRRSGALLWRRATSPCWIVDRW
ncbi:hypothetical protein HN018_22825 (plasmid) [Lichenicola cladoniae]|uniref:Uncharacterized protein n=1 Tax=Lichenicola cladoniae TaxID=1484109 RepID=A0A6M8HXQ8_9PROT|nr:hypothetical protein [Acetobacteraceae bacterium]QKE93036.1 hypothetical protein HN018_22825 [Lichenicola cladoniae]